MAKGATQPTGPLRKELPCDFAVPEAARNKSLMMAVVVGAIGALLLWAAAANFGESPLMGLGIGALGLLALAGAVLVGAAAYTSVHMDDDGIVVRGLGKPQRILWTEMRSILFAATLKGPEHGPAHGVGRALANYMADDVKAGDPYLVGRVRQQYEPSATLSVVKGRRGAMFPSELGWGFFTALYAEAAARGIEIVRG